jgi:hypothetical protein
VIFAVLSWPATPGALGAPASSSASPPAKPLAETLSGEAKQDYELGKILFEDGDFQGAELKFQSVYERTKEPRLIWNIAACEKKQRHYAKVIQLLARYREEARPVLTDAEEQLAANLMKAIEPLTTPVRILVSEPDAEVFVGDERAGVTPLEKPVIIDIGRRQVSVKKPGFRDFSTTLTVAASAEMRVDVKLDPEVHRGTLLVNAPAGARILLDNEPRGSGSWSGTVESRGHTLRVTMPGMIPYQSEVIIQDNDHRTIDVTLQPLEQDSWPRGSPEVGVRTGLGAQFRNGVSGQAPLWIDLGYRPSRPLFIGIIGQLGGLSTGTGCGADVHGPAPSFPTDLAIRFSFTSCIFTKLAAAIAYHFAPQRRYDPWVAFDGGFTNVFYRAEAYDPVIGTLTKRGGDASYFDQLEVQLGLDVHVLDRYRPLAIGPFAAFDVTINGSESLDRSADNGTVRFPPPVVDPFVGFVLGLRGVWIP